MRVGCPALLWLPMGRPSAPGRGIPLSEYGHEQCVLYLCMYVCLYGCMYVWMDANANAVVVALSDPYFQFMLHVPAVVVIIVTFKYFYYFVPYFLRVKFYQRSNWVLNYFKLCFYSTGRHK